MTTKRVRGRLHLVGPIDPHRAIFTPGTAPSRKHYAWLNPVRLCHQLACRHDWQRAEAAPIAGGRPLIISRCFRCMLSGTD